MENLNTFKRFIIFLAIVLLCAFLWSKFNETPSSVNTSSSNTTKFDGESAYYNSKQFVKNILKAPTTAKFEDPCNSCAVQQSDGTWIVKSYVDAQNSFGAVLRQNYECHLSYDLSTDMVKCISVRLIP